MNSTATAHPPQARFGRRLTGGIASVAVVTAGLVGVGLTVAAPAHADQTTIDNAELRWDINKESTSGAFAPGTWNLFSAGKLGNPGAGSQMLTTSDGGATWSNDKPAGWKNSAGNVTVEDKLADGSYAPTTFEGTRRDSTDTIITSGNGKSSENIVSLRNGTGTVDPETNTGTIKWDGDFTIVYYSGMSFFYVSDPELTVNANGTGHLTATLSGYGSDMADMTVWKKLTPQKVRLANLEGVELGKYGLETTPKYKQVEITAPANSGEQVRTGDDWGSFPQAFVNFQAKVGTAQYWYSSGGAADVRKPTNPLSVSWGPSVTVSDTVGLPNGELQVTVTGKNFDPADVTGTRPPLAGKSGGTYIVFGKFADNWRPSEGAPAANRANSDQKWAVRAEDMATIGGVKAGAVELKEDGSFTTTVTLDKAAVDAEATAENLVNYGIYTYPGSGAKNAAFETYTPITFAKAKPAVKVTAPNRPFGKASNVTVGVSSKTDTTGKVVLKRGTATVGTKNLANGKATFAIGKAIKAGKHNLTATFTSTNDNVSNGSGKAVLTIAKAKANMAVKVVKKPKPKAPGRLRVTVKSPTASPKGQVLVKVRNAKGKVVRSPKGKLNAKGIAVINLPKVPAGRYKLAVTYKGNANIKAVNRAGIALRVTK